MRRRWAKERVKEGMRLLRDNKRLHHYNAGIHMLHFTFVRDRQYMRRNSPCVRV